MVMRGVNCHNINHYQRSRWRVAQCGTSEPDTGKGRKPRVWDFDAEYYYSYSGRFTIKINTMNNLSSTAPIPSH